MITAMSGFEICALDAMPNEWVSQNSFTRIQCVTGVDIDNNIPNNDTRTYSISLTGQFIAIIAGDSELDLCEVEMYTGAAQMMTTESVVDHLEMTSTCMILTLSYVALQNVMKFIDQKVIFKFVIFSPEQQVD